MRSSQVAPLFGAATPPDNTGKRRVPFERGRDDAPSFNAVTSTPQFTFAYPAPTLRRSDLIRRCADGTVWQITAVYPDKVTRVICTVSQLGRYNPGDFE